MVVSCVRLSVGHLQANLCGTSYNPQNKLFLPTMRVERAACCAEFTLYLVCISPSAHLHVAKYSRWNLLSERYSTVASTTRVSPFVSWVAVTEIFKVSFVGGYCPALSALRKHGHGMAPAKQGFVMTPKLKTHNRASAIRRLIKLITSIRRQMTQHRLWHLFLYFLFICALIRFSAREIHQMMKEFAELFL